MKSIMEGDILLWILGILALIIVVGVMCVLAYMYHVVYVRSDIEENLIKDNPNRKHYLLTRTERKRRFGIFLTGHVNMIPVYEGPSRDTIKKSEIEPNKLVTSQKYEIGYYYVSQFNGWVSRDDVHIIQKKDKEQYDPAISINHKKHKFSIVIIDPNAVIHVSPDYISRIKFTNEDELIELNREYFSDMYSNNWYFISEFGGWIHEGNVKSKTLY